VFRPRVPQDAIQLVSQLLDYTPGKRLKPLEAMMHSFFDELRLEETKLPNDRPLPPLFNFTPYELSMSEDIQKLLSAVGSSAHPVLSNTTDESGSPVALESAPPVSSELHGAVGGDVTDPTGQLSGSLDVNKTQPISSVTSEPISGNTNNNNNSSDNGMENNTVKETIQETTEGQALGDSQRREEESNS
ncbi:hypothetical protein X801_07748, partial [Opisthorchis viverrini]